MVLQFGSGRFLRGFVDRILSQTDGPPVVVVQRSAGEPADAINAGDGSYPVLVRGVGNGETVDRVETVSGVRGLAADTQWGEVLGVARDPALDLIVSNGTEAAYALEEGDSADAPRSLPAKLAAVLAARCEAGEPSVHVLPVELIERNAETLRDLVLEQAAAWGLPGDQTAFIKECVWRVNLVDCIVTDPAPAHDHPLVVQAEPYGLLALEGGGVPHAEGHPMVRVVDDLGPIALQKVRILNGLHTAMVQRYHVAPERPRHATVRDVLADENAAGWLASLLATEIVPTVAGRCPGVESFAAAVTDRFANPFLEHRLADIALNHEAKLATRLAPTLAEFHEQTGHAPPLLSGLLG